MKFVYSYEQVNRIGGGKFYSKSHDRGVAIIIHGTVITSKISAGHSSTTETRQKQVLQKFHVRSQLPYQPHTNHVFFASHLCTEGRTLSPPEELLPLPW